MWARRNKSLEPLVTPCLHTLVVAMRFAAHIHICTIPADMFGVHTHVCEWANEIIVVVLVARLASVVNVHSHQVHAMPMPFDLHATHRKGCLKCSRHGSR